MLYLTALVMLFALGAALEGHQGSNIDPLNIDEYFFEEDAKFWEKRLQSLLSTTSSPTVFPTFVPPPIAEPSTIPPVLTPSPTEILTPRPSPTGGGPPSQQICQGISQLERAQLLTDIATQASGRIERGSPQDLALEWLIQIDPYSVCPDDPKVLQRYILAVFYFSTNGNNWEQCSAPQNPNDLNSVNVANDNCSVTTTPITGGQSNPTFLPTTEGRLAWLTPVYECEWAGITCRVSTRCVDRIEFGKYDDSNQSHSHMILD